MKQPPTRHFPGDFLQPPSGVEVSGYGVADERACEGSPDLSPCGTPSPVSHYRNKDRCVLIYNDPARRRILTGQFQALMRGPADRGKAVAPGSGHPQPATAQPSGAAGLDKAICSAGF